MIDTSGESVVHTSLFMPQDLHRAVKAYCQARGLKFRHFVSQAARAHLAMLKASSNDR
jgi:hypothetical protein